MTGCAGGRPWSAAGEMIFHHSVNMNHFVFGLPVGVDANESTRPGSGCGSRSVFGSGSFIHSFWLVLGLLKVVFRAALSVVSSNFLVCRQTKQRQNRVFANRDCQRSLFTRVLRAIGALQELVNSLTGQVTDNANLGVFFTTPWACRLGSLQFAVLKSPPQQRYDCHLNKNR